MRHFITSALVALLVVAIAGCSRLTVTTLNGSALKDSTTGFVYALPMTMLTVEIPVMKVTHSFANTGCLNDTVGADLLGGDKALWGKYKDFHRLYPDSAYTFYKLIDKDLSITSRGVPDTSKLYRIDFKGNWRRQQEVTLALNELGVMSKVDMSVEDRTLDIAITGLKGVASIAGSLLGTLGATTSGNAAGSANCTNRLSDQLKKVRDAKMDLLLAKTPSSLADMPEGALKYRIAELDKQEQQLKAQMAFSEETVTYTIKRDILLRNRSDIADPKLLFSFDKMKGITLYGDDLDAYENQYLPYVAKVEQLPLVASTGKKEVASPTNGYYLHLKGGTNGQIGTTLIGGSVKKTIEHGLAYNVPVQTAVVLTKNKKQLKATANVMMPQFGAVTYLPANTGKLTVELDPVTGGLRSMTMKTTAVTTSQVSAVGDTGSSLVKALKKQTLETELAKTTKEASLLEAKIKKVTLQVKLDSLAQVTSKGIAVTNKE